MSESLLTTMILERLNAIPGVFARRQNTGAVQVGGRFVRYGVPGQADIIACVDGYYLELEVKTETGRQSGLQKRYEREVKACGGSYTLVRSVSAAVDAVRALSGDR